MKKIFILALAAALCIPVNAQQLTGFRYGDETAPKGTEWEDPEQLSLNKEQPHAWFFSFNDVNSARKVLPETSKLWKSLDGTWKFNWVGNPEERPVDFYKPDYDVTAWDDIAVPSSWNVVGIQKNGDLKYGTPVYVNTREIFYYRREPGDWKKGVMRTPPTDQWTVYYNRNEVGSYRRDFTVPAEWNGKEIFLNFDGVDSFFYLWINGQYVGFSKNSRNTAQFNISKYLQKGNNTLAVEVYRTSDGSMLEAQDMFRLPGIFRTVALEAKPKVHARDVKVTPSFTDETRTSGKLNVSLEMCGEASKVKYSLYEADLYSDATKLVKTYDNMDPACAELVLDGAKPWSAEAPHRYVLVGELKDAKGKVVDVFSTYTGFRDICIKDVDADDDEFGIAGRYFFVNGKTVKLKGVNRHESHPEVGHAVTRAMMENDVFMMKRANINHVRDCHYPDDPYWYYLCDKYGIYLMDEANIESHEYGYGEATLSRPKEWKAAHVARMMEMVKSNYNHPSIIIWSMGNEAGPGQNFQATYNAAKAFDQSRPVQYERNNHISDIGCSQYPSIAWVRENVQGFGNIKYPYHINEYAHSMGNALGNFVDYWDAMESSNCFMGGAIWDWVDQSLYYYTQDGTKYLAYGGDFKDFPNDGQFEMNGIIFGDREPKPQYYEVKKVHQYVKSTAGDLAQGCINVFNKNYFEPAEYDIHWSVIADGDVIEEGHTLSGSIKPRSTESVRIPAHIAALPAGKECFLNLDYNLLSDLPWAEKGYTVAQDQFGLQFGKPHTHEAVAGKLKQKKNTIKGEGFEVTFDYAQGTIEKLIYGGKTIISEGNGPKLNTVRAFVNNDNWEYEDWFKNGLHNLQHEALEPVVTEKDGTIVLEFDVISSAPCASKIIGGTSSGHNRIEDIEDPADEFETVTFTAHHTWTVWANGTIEFESEIDSDKPELILARLGYEMQIDKAFQNFQYYGRGPVENYNDRCANALIGKYSSTVKEQVTNYTKPQDMSNHEEVRWAQLTDASGAGALFTAVRNSLGNEVPSMSVAAIPYSSLDLIMAPHQFELPEAGDTYLNLCAKVTGLGGNSCGQGGPLEKDRALAGPAVFSFTISPVR